MENQIPAPSFPEQNNANSPQPVPAGVAPGAPLGAAPAGPALGVAPANVRDRDDSYQRVPDMYRVPAEHRRPYGETTGDFRGPGYFYSIGAFGASLGALALTLYAWIQVAALRTEARGSSSGYSSTYSSGLSLSPNIMVIALLLVGLIPVGVSIWLAIYSAKVNAGHTTKYTSKMTTFNILAYIISGLSLLGLLGTLTMLS
ncbi:hypothetical protein [uncultured Rothia sp.]|uniref:hypothetical protein n=1 Tax=uncultured Rothia sp. TaxID=316088 RepID=UPI002889AC60|nr:hypothetical protein [uncultured Rothia sp.]